MDTTSRITVHQSYHSNAYSAMDQHTNIVLEIESWELYSCIKLSALHLFLHFFKENVGAYVCKTWPEVRSPPTHLVV